MHPVQKNPVRKNLLQLALLVLAFCANFAFAQSPGASETLRVEIAEDMNRFAFDASKTFDDGLPAHGSGFVTLGYVYPAGTLNGANGVNPDGSPEFPEAVIGEWICYGYMIGEGAHASSGAWVVSTQVINLSPELGGDSIVTTGYEFADDTPVARAVSGGTGRYAEARGQAVQVFTGLNASEGVVLSVELELFLNAEQASAEPEPSSYLDAVLHYARDTGRIPAAAQASPGTPTEAKASGEQRD